MKNFTKHFMMMTSAIIAALFMFAACTGINSMSRGSGDELDGFIREVSNYLNKQIPQGNRVAVMSADRNLPNLSEYVIDGIMENAVNDRVFTVVDRAQLDAIRSELEFQTSGEVSDETVQSMGRMLGANTVVTVVSSKMGNQYRFRIRALSVESAEILGMVNRNINSNSTIDALVDSHVPPSTSPQSRTSNVAQTSAPTPADIAAAREHLRRGNAFLISGDNNRNAADYERGLIEFVQATRLDPNNFDAHFGVGRSHLRIGDNDNAIIAYSRALELKPNDAVTLSNRGRAYVRIGNFDRAISDFEAAHRIDPNNDLIRQNLDRARQGLCDTHTPGARCVQPTRR